MFSDFKIHKDRSGFIDSLLDWFKTACVTVVTVMLIFTFICRTAVVNGQSMEPTLAENDILMIWSLGYKPKQGDIIACNCYGLDKVIVKRIIAVGGQKVYIDFVAGKVYVDAEEYLVDGIDNITTDQESNYKYPITVPEGQYFVMGDNRQHSTDSRDRRVSLVDRDDILGHAIFRILPFKRAGKL